MATRNTRRSGRGRLTWLEIGLWLVTLPCAALVAWGGGADTEPPPTPQIGPLLADTGGPIEELIVHFTREAAPVTVPTYAALFRSLPSGAAVTVAVADADAFAVFLREMARAGVPAPERFRPLIVDRPISTWARDRFVPRAGTPRSSLLVPARPTDDMTAARRGDWFVPWTLARDRFATLRLDELPLRFDGGDLIATATTLFCDANLLAKNVPDVFGSRAELILALEDLSGLTVELIGDRPEQIPDHHLGMVLSPLPDGRVLVADARLDPATRASDYAALRRAGLPLAYSEDMAERCDFVARWLADRGYEVLRLPLLSGAEPKVFMTYNNVLFEQREGRWRVYMPSYGVAEWDARARAIWESAGATVFDIDVRAIFVHRGSVRCLGQVVRRGPAQTSRTQRKPR